MRKPLGYTAEDVEEFRTSWEEMDDCARIQNVVCERTGVRPPLGICRAIWSARSDHYDASWLILPDLDSEIWEDIHHLFTAGWETRPGWTRDDSPAEEKDQDRG